MCAYPAPGREGGSARLLESRGSWAPSSESPGYCVARAGSPWGPHFTHRRCERDHYPRILPGSAAGASGTEGSAGQVSGALKFTIPKADSCVSGYNERWGPRVSPTSV